MINKILSDDNVKKQMIEFADWIKHPVNGFISIKTLDGAKWRNVDYFKSINTYTSSELYDLFLTYKYNQSKNKRKNKKKEKQTKKINK